MSACSTCKAPIVWAYTRNGKRIPLDAEATEDGLRAVISPYGNLVATEDQIMGIGVVEVRTPGTFVSHFATCAQAGQHRRPKAGAK